MKKFNSWFITVLTGFVLVYIAVCPDIFLVWEAVTIVLLF